MDEPKLTERDFLVAETLLEKYSGRLPLAIRDAQIYQSGALRILQAERDRQASVAKKLTERVQRRHDRVSDFWARRHGVY
jgi:hypothetical protein